MSIQSTIRGLFLLFILLNNFPFLFAQTEDEIDINSPNLNLLEARTFSAVNELRLNKKIPSLVWDDVLYRAAKDHAAYLLKERNLSHSQNVKDKQTPYKRVKLHGGLIYSRVGENLVSVRLGQVINLKGRKLSTQSYNSAALTMTQLWKSSPGHYRNILEKDFNATAIATSYDPESQRAVTVQVFGFTDEPMTPRELPDHSATLLDLPERRLPYNLKEPGQNRKADAKSINEFTKLKFINGELQGSYRTGRRAFKGRRSGIAIETIPLAQYDSGAAEFNLIRNRRNGLYPFNGELTKPVYRREMLRYSRKKSPKYILLNLGIARINKRRKVFRYPIAAGSGTNIFLINKRRPITYTMPLSLRAELLHEPQPVLNFINSFSAIKAQPKYRTEVKLDTVEIKVFYSPGVTTLDSVTTQEIIEAIDAIRGKVVTVEATAHASIEGDMLENQTLAQQRANHFMTIINAYLDTTKVVLRVSGQEQWDLFFQQIEKHKLVHLKNIHKRNLRDYVNTNRNDSLISRLLREQRFTIFRIAIRHDTSIALPAQNAVEKYYAQKKTFELLRTRSASQAALLERAQLQAYAEMIEQNSPDSLDIVDDDHYPGFQYHALMFEKFRGNISDERFYKQLHSFGRMKYFPRSLKEQLIYNNLVLIYRNLYQRDRLDSMMDIPKLHCSRYRKSQFLLRNYKRLRCRKAERDMTDDYYLFKEYPHLISLGMRLGNSRAAADSLSKFYTTSVIRELYAPVLPREIYGFVAKIKPLYHPDLRRLTIGERVRLAFFYCAVNKTDMATSLLAPVIDDPQLDPEGRKLFITLQYEKYKDLHEYVIYLIGQYHALGTKEWCRFITDGNYLNYVLLEDLKLKRRYTCECESKLK